MKIYFLLIISFFSVCSFADTGEYINKTHYERYTIKILEAKIFFERGKYSDAIRSYIDADKMILYEVPNFKLWPELALAYFRNGDKLKAMEYLEKSKISVSIISRLFRCRESVNGFDIVKTSEGEEGYIVKNKYMDFVSSRMCGAMYTNYFYPDDVDGIEKDLYLIHRYFEVKYLIAPSID